MSLTMEISDNQFRYEFWLHQQAMSVGPRGSVILPSGRYKLAGFRIISDVVAWARVKQCLFQKTYEISIDDLLRLQENECY
jgi:hypothetical protein